MGTTKKTPQKEIAPSELKKVKTKDQLTGKVLSIALGGAILDLGLEKPGFLHLTQLSDKNVKRIEDVLSVGQEIEVWIWKINSKKDFIEVTAKEPLALEWREIKTGMTVHGKVTKIERFGAFVEIGAERPGLVHVSEMSHDYIRTPEEAVKVGEEIEAQVLGVDSRKKQIKLSIKALMEKPDAILKALQKSERSDKGKTEDDEPDLPVPTAMEMAIRAAMDKGDATTETAAARPSRKGNQELDDILTRTLENYSE